MREKGDAVNDRIDTLGKLMSCAAEGRLTKQALAGLLTTRPRAAFLSACARIEEGYTDDCIAAGDPCLDSGCSMDSDEVCLQPLLRAGTDYRKACAAEWRKLFAKEENRSSDWKFNVAGWQS